MDWVVIGLTVAGFVLELWGVLYVVREWPSLIPPWFRRRPPKVVDLSFASEASSASRLRLTVHRKPGSTVDELARLEAMIEDDRQQRGAELDELWSAVRSTEARLRDEVRQHVAGAREAMTGELRISTARANRAAILILGGALVAGSANIVGALL